MKYKLHFLIFVVMIACAKRSTQGDARDSLSKVPIRKDTLSDVQKNYEQSMIYRDFDNDSLLIDVREIKALVDGFIFKSDKVKEKEYGAGDYYGRYRVYVLKGDTLIIDKGDGGDYGFANTLYLKRKDSIVLFRKYSFQSIYWQNQDSIAEQIALFKRGRLMYLQRQMISRDWRNFKFNNIPFDTLYENPSPLYQQLRQKLKDLYQMELYE